MTSIAKGIAWFVAARPKTLVASLSPVAVGVALAWRDVGEFSPLLACLCFVFAILMQVGANFANDYFDFIKGADDARTLGPKRAVASGFIASRSMLLAAYSALAVGFALGLVLMYLSGIGWPLLLVGVASVCCALLYTAGPFPLAYVGLGDFFVVLFFGLVATGVTHCVLVAQLGLHWEPSVWAGLAVGLMVNNLLVVNNHRDAEEDAACGKRTLVVRLGRRFGVFFYLAGSVLALAFCPWLETGLSWTVWLLPWAIFLGLKLHGARSRSDYAFLLGGSATLVLVYGAVAAAGIVMAAY